MSIFIFVIFTSFPSFFLSFFFFCPWSLVAFRSGGGEVGEQNLGPRVEKRGGGECKGGEKKKREQWFLMSGKREKELKKWRKPRLKGASGGKFVPPPYSLSVP